MKRATREHGGRGVHGKGKIMFQGPEVRKGESPQETVLHPRVTRRRMLAFTQQGPCLVCLLLCPSHLAGDLVPNRRLGGKSVCVCFLRQGKLG